MRRPMNQDKLVADAARIVKQHSTPSTSATQKADMLETVMIGELEAKVAKPWMANVLAPPRNGMAKGRHLMGNDPRLPTMPSAPTLEDFFTHRIFATPSGGNHLLQSAKLALEKGLSEKVVLACLLHDISVIALIRSDHGYWAAQLVAPYVDEEVVWAIEQHQALRYFAAPAFDYEYPAFYREVFGEDYVVESYIAHAAKEAAKHRWYESAMAVVVNDFYAFDPSKEVLLAEFTDIIGRNFKQPKEGLGFDGSPSAHMWRTIIWPNNFL